MKKLEGSELSFSLSVVVVKLCVSSYCYWEASGGASLTACAHTHIGKHVKASVNIYVPAASRGVF